MLSNSILKSINITSRQFKIWLAHELKDLNIGTSEYFFLTNTPQTGFITAKKLCEIIIVDPALGTRTINNLIKKGYLKKAINPDDKREFLISLTAPGQVIREKIIGLLDQYNLGLQKEFTAEQYQLFLAMTNTLLNYAIATNKAGGLTNE